MVLMWFCAFLERGLQHGHDSVGVLVMIVLSASRLVVVDAVVAVLVVVLWLVVDVAVLCRVVALVPWEESVCDFFVVGGCCIVRYRCLGGGPCAFLESGSSAPSLIIISRISFSTGANLFFRRLDRCCTVNPENAPFNTNDSCKSHPVAMRPMYTVTYSPVVHCISRHIVSSHWPGPSNKALSGLCLRFNLNRCHPTFLSVLGLFLERALRLQEWWICVALVRGQEHEG